MAEEKQKQEKWNNSKLDGQEKLDFEYASKRIQQMQEFRKRPHYGVNLETLWADADRDYVPHRLKTRGKRVVATDEDKGWRGSLVVLGDSNWQSDLSQSNPFVKIQTAQSILVDQNPKGVFTATKKQYESTTILFKQLYDRSWQFANSKPQLKLFIHNLTKYGWACGRTYPLKITRKVRVPLEESDGTSKTKYEEKEVIVYNDIYRENLDPRNVWIDDMARPNDSYSLRDWTFRKLYTVDQVKELFPEEKYPRVKFVQSSGTTSETVDGKSRQDKQFEQTDLVEVYYYENIEKDLFIVRAGEVPIIIEPLPVSDSEGAKKLSLWQAYWNLRHAESPYGIGIYEAIRYDHAFLDRIRNMTLDQLTLSIYKMFFYTGTQNLQDTGEIRIAPGIGKQVLNPKDINWLEVPGPGRDAYAGIELSQKDIDTASGITEPIIGEVTGKTAFELAQAREAALKRLKTPLENILDALNTEGQITISLIQLLYSVPEVFKIADQQKIEDYLREIQSDPELYERQFNPETGEEDFYAKVFPEFPLNLDTDEQNNLIETEQTRFFRTKPSGLRWYGLFHVKAESVLSSSKQIDKALDLEMYNMLIPLLAQPPQIYLKIAKNLCKLYDKDPRDILPDEWIMIGEQPQQEQPMFVPQQMGVAGQTPLQPPQAQQFVSRTAVPEQPQGIAGRMMSKLTSAFR